jgi:hypothetical protein
MNPIGIKCLQDIRKIPGFEKAIIAGGMVRDHLMKGSFTDIDVFVPIENKTRFTDNILKYQATDKNPLFTKFNTAGGFSRSYKDLGFIKLDAKYMGSIDVDIMVDIMGMPNNKDLDASEFAKRVVSTFNYNIDRVFWDGEDVNVMEEANRDIRNHVATLVKAPKSPRDLPKVMEKFFKLQKKYPHMVFDTTLEITEKNNKEKTRQDEKIERYRAMYGGPANGGMEPDPDNWIGAEPGHITFDEATNVWQTLAQQQIHQWQEDNVGNTGPGHPPATNGWVTGVIQTTNPAIPE